MILTPESIDSILKPLITSDSELWIAFSGGIDSRVLLQLLWQLYASTCHLTAIYINHAVNPAADAWENQCCKVCRELKISFCSSKLILPQPLKNPEATLRDLRYAELAKHLPSNAYLLTAHHADDEAETFLLQALRGSGVKGLSGMPFIKPFGKGYLIRPLLNYTRAEIKQYALKNGLKWIEDESNYDLKFARNYLRNRVMPLLTERWQESARILGRVARHAAEAAELSDNLAQADLIGIQSDIPERLKIQPLLALSFARQKNLLRYWLTIRGFSLPSSVQLEHLLTTLITKQDRTPIWCWRGVIIRKYRDELEFISSDIKLIAAKLKIISSNKIEVIYGVENFILDLPTYLNSQEITLLKNSPGMKIKFLGQNFHHRLKKLFQAWGVPPWERPFIPLIGYQNHLIAVPKYYSATGITCHKNG